MISVVVIRSKDVLITKKFLGKFVIFNFLVKFKLILIETFALRYCSIITSTYINETNLDEKIISRPLLNVVQLFRQKPGGVMGSAF